MTAHFKLEKDAGFSGPVCVYVWQNTTPAAERCKDAIYEDLAIPNNFRRLQTAVELVKLEMAEPDGNV
jgi:hypothetical protein